MTPKHILLAMSAVLGATTLASLASASDTEILRDEKDYEYRFKDEIMNGDTLSSATPQIRVVKAARRDRLLRPRLHLVPEMLKSVEEN